jgi:hypothetical protein
MKPIKSIMIMGMLFAMSAATSTANAFCYVFEDSNTGNRWIMSGDGAPPASQLDIRRSAEKRGNAEGANLRGKRFSDGSWPCDANDKQSAFKLLSFQVVVDHEATALYVLTQMPFFGHEPDISMKPVRTLADDPLGDLGSGHVSVVISKNEISLNGKPLIQLAEHFNWIGGTFLAVPGKELKGQIIAALLDSLVSATQERKRMQEKSRPIFLNVDEEVPFEIVAGVMATAGQAEFSEFEFIGVNRWQDELVSFSHIQKPYEELMARLRALKNSPVFQLQIYVVITKEGLSVRSNDPEFNGPSSRDLNTPTLPCAGGRPCGGVADYPWVNFNAWLSRAKAKYPNAVEIIIAPEGDISWDILARTMDYARSEPFLDMDASQADWSAWKMKRKDLFPLPVLALGTRLDVNGSSKFGTRGDGSSPKSEGGIGRIGGDPIILGALDKSLIDRVIKRNMNQIKYCYSRQLNANPTLNGKIVVKFVISGDGSVSQAKTHSSTMTGGTAVQSCINERILRFQFPEPRGGGIVIVQYPFLFAPE